MEYKIFRSDTYTDLCRNINNKLKEGGELIGGVSFDTKSGKYIQAMLLKDKSCQKK